VNHNNLLVPPKQKISLDEYDPAYTDGFKGKADVERKLTQDIERMTELQDVFYASHKHALLIVLQGMDTSGKDGVIKHVMAGMNPQGVRVTSFKQPSPEELQHDFLWRSVKALPPSGHMGIFNRSYYEEVLVTRVHPELLEAENTAIPKKLKQLWNERYEDIRNFELHLNRNNTIVLKFFLNISYEEQKRRLLKRIDNPGKNWKFSPSDLKERAFWPQYRKAYEDALNETSTAFAPWYVIPADNKWFARIAIADVIMAKLKSLKLKYPTLKPSQLDDLRKAKKLLKRQ
jgi:PPK2 family polyphosphate:nucleotide phosphotransferase